jgi:hypothetical protein
MGRPVLMGGVSHISASVGANTVSQCLQQLEYFSVSEISTKYLGPKSWESN